MRKTILILIIALPCIAFSQERGAGKKMTNKLGHDYFIFYNPKKQVAFHLLDEISYTVEDYGYSYFSLVKRKKRNYVIGAFDLIADEKIIVIMHKSEPKKSGYWKISYETEVETLF